MDELLARFVPPPSGHRDWLTIDLPGLLMTDDPVIVDVTGGAAGVAASYAAARALADAFDEAGDRLRGWGTDGLRTMRDPDLLESGLLSPGSCAEAEEALMAAAAGPHGAIAASLGWEADAMAVRAAIAYLEETDLAVRAAVTAVDRRLAPARGGRARDRRGRSAARTR